MKTAIPIRIVILDDNFRTNDPLVIALEEEYGEKSVEIFRHSDEGIEFILKNLSSKIVVLLDMDLGENERRGDAVFREIREKTTLVTVIIMSANLPALTNEELRGFINNHAFSTIKSNDGVKVNLPIIKNAVNQLNLRVDCALEEWILRNTPDDREKPFLTLRTGEKYSLNQVLTEIRKGNESELGMFFQESILNMAVELLARQKESL